MNYLLEDIANALKEARERKGLSQRALSKLTGVPQGQISRIENGAVDLRLSSLIELARAVDLELTLVPRKSIAAVKSIVRSGEPKVAATPALKELNRTLQAVKDLRAAYPDLSALTKLQNSIQTISNMRELGGKLEALREITKPVRELQKITDTSRELSKAAELPTAQLEALQHAARVAQNLRNQLVHHIPEPASEPRPAYSLDEDEDG